MATRAQRDRGKNGQRPAPSRDSSLPLRLAVGLGDPVRERELLPDLTEAGEFVVAERCLAADQLLTAMRAGRVDAVLVAFDLHRLTSTTLTELTRSRVPLILLAPHPVESLWRTWPGIVLPLESDSGAVRRALEAAGRGERLRPAVPSDEPAIQPVESAQPTETPPATLSVLAVASGQGSPGRTTVALNLAAALGAVAPTVLVDADLSGPSVAAYLDADPTRNLYMLAHTEPVTPREWERAIEQETQALAARSPREAVLCGVPKPEMRTEISSRFFERLIAELQHRYRFVILDVGTDLLGSEAGLHHASLAVAQQILLVASADLVGLWHARTALRLLRTQLQINPEAVALIINRHDRHYHHGRTEIEWALGVPTAAVIPHDHRAVQRALAAQRPLVLAGRGRAARGLLDLAERVHGGDIVLPPEPSDQQGKRWPGWTSAPRLRWPWRPGAKDAEKGVPHGDDSSR